VTRRTRKAVLITDAPESPERELRRREIRYVLMMGLRAVCLVLGAVLVSTKPPLWPLWLVLCLVGMVTLPWFAVLLANDRPARRRQPRPDPTTPPGAAPTALPAPRDPNVIDG
jgi:hypothetical protein